MPALAIADRLSFVNNLKLPDPPPTPPTPPTPGAPSASVDGATVISFVGSVDPQSQSDALNSTLLAYLSANAQYDPIKETVNWYSTYRQTLLAVGWDPQDFDFTQYTASAATLKIDQVVLEIVTALVGVGAELAVVEAALQALQNLPSTSGIMQIWNTQSHTENSGNFMMNVANETNGVMSLGISAFYFTTTETVHEVFFTTYSSDAMSLFESSQNMTLDNDIYSSVRAQIVAKLQPYAQAYVAKITLPPLPPRNS